MKKLVLCTLLCCAGGIVTLNAQRGHVNKTKNRPHKIKKSTVKMEQGKSEVMGTVDTKTQEEKWHQKAWRNLKEYFTTQPVVGNILCSEGCLDSECCCPGEQGIPICIKTGESCGNIVCNPLGRIG